MELGQEVVELATHLKQERLYVAAEQRQLQVLYQEVHGLAEQVYHHAWISRQQRSSLDAAQQAPSHRLQNAYTQHNGLEETVFVDGHKSCLGYHDSQYGEVMRFLRDNPTLVGHMIATGENNNAGNTVAIISTLVSAVYGNLLLPEDELSVLRILTTLTDLQLAHLDSPDKILRHGNCAFSVVYKQLCESLHMARVYLTTTLHDPIMRVLMEDEWFYDIEPSKAMVRFTNKDLKRRFGDPGTEHHKTEIAKYRAKQVEKLVQMANRFVQQIRSTIDFFPPPLAWIIAQIYRTLSKKNTLEAKDIRSTCYDLMFTLFICPAICVPEPCGVVPDSVSISHIARSNLMQLAQIVQYLAKSSWEEVIPQSRDLFSQFDRDCLSSLLDMVVASAPEGVPPGTGTNQSMASALRSAVLITQAELSQLLGYVRCTLAEMEEETPGKKELQKLLNDLPPDSLINPPPPPQQPPTSSSGPTAEGATGAVASNTPPGTPGREKRMLRSKSTLKKKHSTSSLASPEEVPIGDAEQMDNTDSKAAREVIVISLGISSDCPGMLPEQKVLSWEQDLRRRRVKYPPVVHADDAPSAVEVTEKRTRFSLSHDQESIGNASDYQEAVSEGASSHSVDLENDDLENDNDNFSDMMSANVSGRGSPSISGRDTPLSQAGSAEEANPRPPQLAVPVPPTIHKPHREDVTERFGKFEIKAELERDETKSTVSDTWSTDVLASDSEPPEQNQLERLEEVSEDVVRPFLLPPPSADLASSHSRETDSGFPDISETASDAWSTDVLASDTDEKHSELLTDLEQDDLSSMTERSETQEDADPSGNEDTPGRGSLSGELEGEVGAVGGSAEDYVEVFSSEEGEEVRRVFPPQPHARMRSSLDAFSLHSSDGLGGSGKPDRFSKSNGLPPESGVGGHMDRRSKQMNTQRAMEGVLNWSRTNRSEGNFASAALPVHHHNAHPAQPVDWPQGGPAKLPNLAEKPIRPLPPTAAPEMKRIGGPSLPVAAPLEKPVPSGLSGELPLGLSAAGLEELDPLYQRSQGSAGAMACPLVQLDTSSLQDNEASAGPPPLPAPAPVMPVAGPSISVVGLGAGLPSAGAALPLAEKMSGLSLNTGTPREQGVEEKLGLPQHRRDSSDSSHSTTSQPGYSEPPLPDRLSIHSDEKDFADMNDGGGGDTEKGKKGFFRSVHEKFKKGIKRKNTKVEKDSNAEDAADSPGRAEAQAAGEGLKESKSDIIEDILAKYKKKPIVAGAAPNAPEPLGKPEEEAPVYYNPNDVEGCVAFQDAKQKLRMVLCSSDFSSGLGLALGRGPTMVAGGDNQLVGLLRLQLAEAINLQNRDMQAQLHEAIRCIRHFDNSGCKRLIRAVREEYRSRAVYISYLVRCRQGLLMARSQLQRLGEKVKRNKEILGRHLVNQCVKAFLEDRAKEMNLQKFIADFQECTASDEKTALVEEFLGRLVLEMDADTMWKAATGEQREAAHQIIERSMMSRIYVHAMYPNREGDLHRDQVFGNCIADLKKTLTPSHPYLKIPAKYHYECPWPAAQREIFMINAYKTPSDKVQCIMRCSRTIMNLLSMASAEHSVPAADDFLPVLIYVVICANPPSLLSTIEYVNNFYGNRLEGEQAYWWSQLQLAVQAIKIMTQEKT